MSKRMAFLMIILYLAAFSLGGSLQEAGPAGFDHGGGEDSAR
jgi:hypothetical protein